MRLVTGYEPDGAWTLPQQFHIDRTKGTSLSGVIPSVRTDQQLVTAAEDLLNQGCARTAAKDVGCHRDVPDRGGDPLQSLAPMLDQVSLSVRCHKTSDSRRHPRQYVDDLHARMATRRERYRPVECRVVRCGCINVDEDVRYSSHVYASAARVTATNMPGTRAASRSCPRAN
jgi:hypothetical protein